MLKRRAMRALVLAAMPSVPGLEKFILYAIISIQRFPE
jgi:hypothetical protein